MSWRYISNFVGTVAMFTIAIELLLILGGHR